jgi:putative ABC transport system permease protein
MHSIWQDLRYGVRLLTKNLGFTSVAVLTLALGVGANTAIFQLLNAVLLRSLPARNPDELVEVKPVNGSGVSAIFNGAHPHFTYPMWEQFRDHQEPFSETFAWAANDFNLSTGGVARAAHGIWISGEFFQVLGVQPILGRVIASEDDQLSRPSAVAVISHSFWQREYGGDLSVIGKQLTLDGHPFAIIGVTPEGFHGIEVGRSFDVAVPISAEPLIRGERRRLERRDYWWLAVVGRLKPGWPLTKASASLGTISPGLFEATVPSGYDAANLEKYRAMRLAAFPIATGFSSLRAEYESALWLLFGTATLVLLIACTNLANLMLARASIREKEIAVRLALGASRGRLVRQLMAESLLLALAGAAAGLLLAQYLSEFLISALSTRNNTLFLDLGLDWRVLTFIGGVAFLTCILFGLAPALRATRTTAAAVLKASGRGLSASRERFGLRRMLVVSQISLSLVLVVVALLFSRTFRNLLVIDPGFHAEDVLIAHIDLSRLKPAGRQQSFKRELLDRLRRIPGVNSAADTTLVPLSGSSWSLGVVAGTAGDHRDSSKFTWVSTAYFQTIGTPLIAGRDFSDNDTAASTRVAIVNESFQREFFDGGDPLGLTFRTEAEPGYPSTQYEIVGVVKDTRYNDLTASPPPIAYAPEPQDPSPANGDHILIRSGLPPNQLTASITQTIGELNPDIGIYLQAFKDQIRELLLGDRLMASLSGFFGLLAVLLATVGLYGVVSYMVAERRNEIGIRLALGAEPRSIVVMVLREATVLLLTGVGIGTALAVVAARSASAMLFGFEWTDPFTFLMSGVLLVGVALLASYLPAQRAARLDPMMALREE